MRLHGWWAVVCSLALAATAVLAQGAANESTTASLPVNNEALLLSNRAEQAIAAGDYRLAIELIERIRAMPPSLVSLAAGRSYHPLWRHANRLSAAMPPEGVETYRQLFDGEVEARHAPLSQTAAIDGLRELFIHYRLSSLWSRIGLELAALLVDAGRGVEALDVLDQLESGGVQSTIEQSALRLIALVQSGAASGAERLLVELAARIEDEDLDRWRRRLPALADAVSAARRPSAGADAQVASAPLWSLRPTGLTPAQARSLRGELADLLVREQTLPLHEPLITNDRVLLRGGGQIIAIDAWTLTPLWTVSELPSATDLSPFSESPRPSAGRRTWLRQHLAHVLAADVERVYAVEALAAHDAPSGHRAFIVNQAPQHNELTARDVDTGRLLWRTGDTIPFAGSLEFQDRPITIGDRLIVPARRGEALHLVELDARDGAIRRSIEVVGPPPYFTREGGRCLISADPATIYLSTGLGVLAAFHADDLSWKWAVAYSSSVAEQLGRLWWKPATPAVESGVDRPLLSDDLYIAAPIDSLDIMAVERRSGRERWRRPRGEAQFLVGVLDDLLIVGGAAIVALDLDDPVGRPPRWRSIPLEIVGRPTLMDDRVYVPTRRGLTVIDARTGRLVLDQGLAIEWRGGSSATLSAVAARIVAGPHGLFEVSPFEVVKYPSPNATRSHFSEADSDDPTAATALAWLDLFEGNAVEALRRLESLTGRDAAGLRIKVYSAMAEATDDPAQRLTWLERAYAEGVDPIEAASFALRIATHFEQTGDAAAAARWFVRVALGPAATWDAGNGLQRAAWAEALRRWSDMAQGRDAAPALNALRDALQDRALHPARLARFAPSSLPSDLAAELARRIVTSDLAPELRARWLVSAVDDSTAPRVSRRRLALERWSVALAVDDAPVAREARDAWRANFAHDDDLDYEEADLADALDVTQRKLEFGASPPFTSDLRLQWRIPGCDLITPQDGITIDTRWLLIHAREARQVQNIDSIRYQNPQRKIPLRAAGEGSDAIERAIMDRPFGFGGPQPPPQALVWRNCAAVVLDDGVITFGLGPERGGGQRWWRRDWPPTGGFDNQRVLTAGPEGVYAASAGRIELLDWSDGATIWSTLAPEGVFDLRIVRERLAVQHAGGVRWLDARFGTRMADARLEGVESIHAVEDVLVVSSANGVFALSPDTAEPRWRVDAPATLTPVAESNWVILRDLSTGVCRIVSADDGRELAQLERFGSIDAAALAPEGLLVSGVQTAAGEYDRERRIELRDVQNGTLRWSTPFETTIAPHAGQLRAHPTYIPLLLDGNPDPETGGRARPMILLVNRLTGEPEGPIDVSTHLPRGAGGAPQMVATASRVLLQWDGNLLAFGSPAR